MTRPLAILAVAVAGLVLAAAPGARAEDGIFGSFFSRTARPEAPKAGEARATDREREARNLRRDYWERERARLSSADAGRALSRDASSRDVAAR